MAQLPNLGGLALRPCQVPTGAGDGKKQKTDNPERDLQDLWRGIIRKVKEYQTQGGGDFFRALIEELNRKYTGLITPDYDVEFKVVEGDTSQEQQRNARQVILKAFKQLTQKRRAENQPVLGPAKVQKRLTADQAARQRNAQQSQHMEEDREDDAPAHFRDAQMFVSPQPWSGMLNATDSDRKGDLERKSPPQLAALVAKRDADGGRCCAADQ